MITAGWIIAKFLNRATGYFLKIVSTGSFAEAARQLHVSQPALSLAIKKFEEDLGGQLFARAKKNAAVTPLGRRLYETLAALDQAITRETSQVLQADYRPRLRIGSIPWFATKHLLPALPPATVSHGQFFIRPAGLIKSAVRRARIDFAFINWPRRPNDVLSHPVCDDPAVVAGLKSRFAHIENARSYKDLADEPWLFGESRGIDWTQSIPVEKSGFLMSDVYAMKALVMGGYGIYELQLAYFSEAERRRLATANFRTRYANNKIYAIWRPDISRESKLVLDELIQTFGNLKG